MSLGSFLKEETKSVLSALEIRGFWKPSLCPQTVAGSGGLAARFRWLCATSRRPPRVWYQGWVTAVTVVVLSRVLGGLLGRLPSSASGLRVLMASPFYSVEFKNHFYQVLQ